jgi:hypothetical protein
MILLGSLRCWLFGHDTVSTLYTRKLGGDVNRVHFAQCVRCGYTVRFERDEEESE